MSPFVNYDNYNNSQNDYNNQVIIDEVLEWAHKTSKLEAGPIYTLDDALTTVKPDEYIGEVKNKTDPLYTNDPCVWWIVNRTPPCFKWMRGKCDSDNCGFHHFRTTYIRVELVGTKDMLRKMYNRNRKLKLSAQKKNKDHYVNPFTGKWIQIQSLKKEKMSLAVRRATVAYRTSLMEEFVNSVKFIIENLKSFSPHNSGPSKVPGAPKKLTRMEGSWTNIEGDEEEILKVEKKVNKWTDLFV